MPEYMYVGTADEFTVKLYPTVSDIVRQYRSGKSASVLSTLYYMEYSAGQVKKEFGRARHREWLEQFLANLGRPVSSLRWRATICAPYDRAPWHIYRRKGSNIYFVTAEGTNFLKIGYATDVASRIDQIRAGCPYPMRVIASIPGTKQDEHQLHLRFRQFHNHNEWFRLEGDLLAYVDSLTSNR